VAAAIARRPLPALDAARAAPAAALKSESPDVPFARLRSAVPGMALLAIGAIATFGPPVAGLPLLGYASIAALLFGTLLMLPQIIAAILSLAPQPARVAPALA